MLQHRAVALVVGQHHEASRRIARGDVAHVEGQVEVQRVLARARDGHAGHAVAEGGLVLVHVALAGAVEQPHVRHVGHQGADLGVLGLHVLPVHQHVGLRQRGVFRAHRHAGLDGRVLARVFHQLAAHRALQVHRGVVGHLQQVQQHVGHFVGDALLRHMVVMRRLRLLGRHPLEDLGQLGGLDHQRHRQVLGRVKGLPVTLGSELAQGLLQRGQVQSGLLGRCLRGEVSTLMGCFSPAGPPQGTERPPRGVASAASLGAP